MKSILSFTLLLLLSIPTQQAEAQYIGAGRIAYGSATVEKGCDDTKILQYLDLLKEWNKKLILEEQSEGNIAWPAYSSSQTDKSVVVSWVIFGISQELNSKHNYGYEKFLLKEKTGLPKTKTWQNPTNPQINRELPNIKTWQSPTNPQTKWHTRERPTNHLPSPKGEMNPSEPDKNKDIEIETLPSPLP